MKTWWDDLSKRERGLVMIAVGLASVLALSLGVIRPMGAWGQSAAADLERAQASLELVSQAAAAGVRQTAEAPNASVPLRQAITTTAGALQIDLVRIGAEVDGQTEVQPAPVSGDVFFEWINTLAIEYGVRVQFAEILRASDGRVEAQVVVFSRGQ